MESDWKPKDRPLVPADEHQLIRRSATLVRRGLDSISEQPTHAIVDQSSELTSVDLRLLDALLQGPQCLGDLFWECFLELEPCEYTDAYFALFYATERLAQLGYMAPERQPESEEVFWERVDDWFVSYQGELFCGEPVPSEDLLFVATVKAEKAVSRPDKGGGPLGQLKGTQ